jgi:hypothetical protein
MTTITAETMELPSMPAPEFPNIFWVASYYVGPGFTNRWKIHKEDFATEAEAIKFSEGLERWHLHKRIIKIV